eukprot:1160807-Pelagomonas_calceolata.AAC.3
MTSPSAIPFMMMELCSHSCVTQYTPPSNSPSQLPPPCFYPTEEASVAMPTWVGLTLPRSCISAYPIPCRKHPISPHHCFDAMPNLTLCNNQQKR